MKKLWLFVMPLVLVACASAPSSKRGISDAQCMGLASSLQTLQAGDPLPRVKEVLGKPSRSYRVGTTWGGKRDVLEYDTGRTPCVSYLLNSPLKLVLQFDQQGRLMSYGRTKFMPIQGATSVRTGALPGAN
jgi:hypothetical protein